MTPTYRPLRGWLPHVLLPVLAAATCFAAQPSRAAGPVAPETIAQQISSVHPKTVVLVFDVSGSTRSGGVFSQERAASGTILRQGCSPGDHVVLLTFGTGWKAAVDTVLQNPGQAAAIADTQLPATVDPTPGTNIRWPHAAALKIVQNDLPHPGVVVLLTDSFNDRPKPADPNYKRYLDYYTLRSLTDYPDTRENRQYESLLRSLRAAGKLTQYGVGVGIAPSGRPIERLPVGPGQGDASAADQTQTPVYQPYAHDTAKHTVSPLLWLLPLFAIVAALGIFMSRGRRYPVRLSLGGKALPQDYALARHGRIALGGSMATAATDEVFPISGLPAPAGWLQAAGGQVVLVAAAPTDPPVSELFHNGLRVTEQTPVHVDDEIRVAQAASSTGPARDVRIRILDPKAPLR